MKIPKVRDEELMGAIEWARADAEDDFFCPDYVRYADHGLTARQDVAPLRTSCPRPDCTNSPGYLSRDLEAFSVATRRVSFFTPYQLHDCSPPTSSRSSQLPESKLSLQQA